MDGRAERGDRTRRAVAEQAAAVASVDGLSGMSFARLAAALGVSKSSIQAAYGTKEELQLAAVAAASRTFVAEVVEPASRAAEGMERLRALVDAWLGYVERRVFPGGCFMASTLPEVDSRPGAVRDALRKARRGWLGLLEQQAAAAQAAGALPAEPSARLVAFEIDAVLMAANLERNLRDDVAPLADARALIGARLAGPAAQPA